MKRTVIIPEPRHRESKTDLRTETGEGTKEHRVLEIRILKGTDSGRDSSRLYQEML